MANKSVEEGNINTGHWLHLAFLLVQKEESPFDHQNAVLRFIEPVWVGAAIRNGTQ